MQDFAAAYRVAGVEMERRAICSVYKLWDLCVPSL